MYKVLEYLGLDQKGGWVFWGEWGGFDPALDNEPFVSTVVSLSGHTHFHIFSFLFQVQVAAEVPSSLGGRGINDF